MREEIRESSIGTRLENSFKQGMFICQRSKRTIPISVHGRYQTSKQNRNIEPTWKILMKDVDQGEQTSFLDHVFLGMHSQRV